MFYTIKKATGAIPRDIAHKFPKEHRARQFLSSRSALSDSLVQLGLPCPDSLLKLKIIDHQRLESNPKVLASLSHTGDFGAAVVAFEDETPGCGIDIERNSRKMKEETRKMFVNEKDHLVPLLELWCQKEAAFKAIWPHYTEQKNLVLKDIWVNQDSFGLNSDPSLTGTITMVQNHFDLMASIALLDHPE